MKSSFKILIVDDEVNLVKIVAKRLESEGFEVCTAMDGDAALKQTALQNPDLIILDIMLPRLNGYEVCRRLKQDGRTQKIPVILFTAKMLERDEQMGYEAGADAYVRKPFRTGDLLGEIRRLLPREGSQDAQHPSVMA
ncbi:MAG: response regulator [Candidatus Omnitrophica bacterium]|nr:response regulator [Candidatus Omnitrophota bacterium]